MQRTLYLLSPYRLPGRHTLMLNDDDAAAWLNGYLALWQPAVVALADAPPRVESPYDHENPSPSGIYALPENPPLYLPEEWEARAREAGAVFFRASADRRATEARLRAALGAGEAGPGVDRLAALGLAFLYLDAIFEALDHSNQVNVPEFWADAVRAAQASDESVQTAALAAAAEKLREAREVLFPGVIFLLDLALADDLPTGEMPPPIAYGLPANLVAAGRDLEALAAAATDAGQRLRERVQRRQLEICTGPYFEREDSLRPIESQLWNLRRGIAVHRELLGCDPAIYGRRRFAGLPELPQMLALCGFTRAVQIAFDESVMPAYQSALVEWSSAAGARLAAFTLKPLPADSPLTWFHLAYHLARTMQQEATPVLALRHSCRRPLSGYYHDWLELNRLAPVFGNMATLSTYFEQAACGDYPPPAGVDDYLSNYLEELADAGAARPVSRFAELQRARQRLEALWTLAALAQGLGIAGNDAERDALANVEEALETASGEDALPERMSAEVTLRRLSDLLVSGATSANAGHLLFNPCSFARRIGVELSGVRTPLPAPAKATQLDSAGARAVVEVPSLGYVWVPNAVAPGTKVAVHRGQLAEDRLLRNEYLEAEVDSRSGGLRTIRANRLSGGRLGQQLCFGPGSEMVAESIHVASSGAAMAEIVARGVIRGGQQEVLARYRQHFRVWWGRPILELRIELDPTEPPAGYPWHAYFAARFAWRDPRAALARSVGFLHQKTSQTRPETPYYLELQSGLVPGRTAILTGGLPFLHRHSQRMVDVILLPPGETARSFELAIGLDLDDPMQAAIDWITPAIVVPTAKGPPHVGAAGWFFHLDASNLLMTSLRPASRGDGVVARIVECRGLATAAELRCPRPPAHAALVDEFDRPLADLPVAGDAVALEFAPGAIQRIRVEF